MEPLNYVLDPSRSRVQVETGTEGMFSPLAHDLALEARPSAGTATGSNDSWSATLTLSASEFHVVGVKRRGKIDREALSSRDRSEIERKIREEVLVALPELRMDASGERSRGEVKVAGRARSGLSVSRFDLNAQGVHVEGECELSLRAMGIGPVKGPLGAFRVADALTVRFDLMFKR